MIEKKIEKIFLYYLFHNVNLCLKRVANNKKSKIKHYTLGGLWKPCGKQSAINRLAAFIKNQYEQIIIILSLSNIKSFIIYVLK